MNFEFRPFFMIEKYFYAALHVNIVWLQHEAMNRFNSLETQYNMLKVCMAVMLCCVMSHKRFDKMMLLEKSNFVFVNKSPWNPYDRDNNYDKRLELVFSCVGRLIQRLLILKTTGRVYATCLWKFRTQKRIWMPAISRLVASRHK